MDEPLPGTAPFCSVALPVAIPKTFDYGVPPPLRPALRAGCRVRVPFGARIAVGYCTALRARSEHESLKEILEVLDEEPVLDPHLLELGRWIGRRYAAGWGEVLQAMLPPGVRGDVHARRHRVLRATTACPRDAATLDALDRRAPAQARALRALLDAGGEIPVGRLPAAARGAARAMIAKGWIEEADSLEAPAPPEGTAPPPAPPTPTPAQDSALRAVLDALGTYRKFLLEGITGSGKTEVYLRALAEAVRRGGQGLYLIPEIALTPQTERRIRERFARVAVLHSQLSEGDRAAAWRAAAAGDVDVVVGARSAVLTPLARLALIVIDEEHEPSYKQDSKPRYDARAVADRRARILGIPLVLGSATPSLESYHEARNGAAEHLTLPERVAGGALPPVQIVDLRVQAEDRKGWRILSAPLLAALEGALREGRQAILFLNRRGYATAIWCRRCGHVMRCRHCAVALVLHRDRGRALCHTCAWSVEPPTGCPECGFGEMARIGAGTERVAHDLARYLPTARIATFDADATRFRGAHEKILDQFRDRAVDILVGTQMVAKGLDFPNVSVVGVISCDTHLHLPDPRAAERTFQLLAQVAGRAGRGPAGGRVLFQTTLPEHPSIVHAARHDYRAFAAHEMAQRKPLGYPPFARLVRILVHGRHADRVRMRAEQMAATLRRRIDALPETGRPTLLGPCPAPYERLEGRTRWHMLVKGWTGEDAYALLGPGAGGAASGVRIDVDVDPQNLL